ncbi:MAG: sel1 repeat family protein [Gammaproteobacteria bacterium]|nr:sel1 repeat family protein [Gammaproteobacteria bacterium]
MMILQTIQGIAAIKPRFMTMVFVFLLASCGGAGRVDMEALSSAATNGNIDAQYELGKAYLDSGMLEDKQKAAAVFELAAGEQHAGAQYELGMMYYRGEGVIQDYRYSHDLFVSAARQNNPDAQFMLGWIYQYGKGVELDVMQAHMWYNIAASNGHTEAMESRASIAKAMTKEQVEEAQTRARALQAQLRGKISRV